MIGDTHVAQSFFPIASSAGPFGPRSTAIDVLAMLGDRRAIAMLAVMVVKLPTSKRRTSSRASIRGLLDVRLDDGRRDNSSNTGVSRRYRFSWKRSPRPALLAGGAYADSSGASKHPVRASPRPRRSIGDSLALAWGALALAVMLSALIAFIVAADTLGRIIGGIILAGAIAFSVHVARRVLAEMSRSG